MPFIGNAGQFSNIYEKNYETTTLRVVEGDAAYQAYNPADSHYKLITNLQEITDIGNVTSNTVQFSNAITGFTTTSNVGVANSAPVHTLDIGSNVFIDDVGATKISTTGTIHADEYTGSTVTVTDSVTTRDVITDRIFPKTNGFVQFTSNVGILNTAPTHTLDIGANVQIDEYGSNTFWTSGNVYSEHYKGSNVTVTGSIDSDAVIVNMLHSKDTDFIHTTSNVGILNTAPTHTLDIGANVQIDEYGSNTFWTSGNVYANIYTGTEIQLSGVIRASEFVLTGGSQANPIPELQAISEVPASGGSAPFSSDRTMTLSNTTTALDATVIQSITTYSNLIGDNVVTTSDITGGTTFYVKQTTNQVGINKAEPTKALDVTGEIMCSSDLTVNGNLIVNGTTTTINTTTLSVKDALIELGKDNVSGTSDLGLIMSRPDTASNVAIFYNEGDDKLQIGYTLNGASDTDITFDTSNKLPVDIQGNLQVGTANLFVNTTTSNVGIGTSTPEYTLDVVGDINLSGDFYQGGSLFVSSLWTSETNSLYYRSNVEVGTANLFVDTTTSNVGIGTSTPGYTLDVHGTSNVGTLTVTSVSGDGSGLTLLNADNLSSGSVSSDRLSLVASDIPSLDADKITTGTLGTDRIPNLDAGKITTGTLGTDRIPSLDADKITTGTLGTDRIPSLDADKITTGTLGTDRIPDLDAGKITSGTLGVPIDTTTGVFNTSVSFGSSTQQMVNLYSTTYGLGVQSSTLYYRSDDGYAWFKGGVHADTANDAGTGGALAMKLDSSYNLTASGDVTAFSDKRVKTDIMKIDDALNKVCSINGYTYKRIDTDDDKTHTGVLAQEVMKCFQRSYMAQKIQRIP